MIGVPVDLMLASSPMKYLSPSWPLATSGSRGNGHATGTN